MKKAISLVVLTGFFQVIAPFFASGQLEWESAYWDQIDRAKEFPMAVQVWADALQGRAHTQGHCDSLNLAHAVLISLGNLERSDKLLSEVMMTLPGCDTAGYVTWYSIGVHHYLNKRLPEAKKAFEQSLLYNPKTSRQVSTWHAIGTLANQIGDLQGAYAAYKTAYELEPESDNPLRLSNLATMNISLRDYATALDWLKLAEEAWNDKTEEMAQRLPQDFGEVILRNRLLCAYELEMWEAAAHTFNRLQPGPFDGQDPAVGAATVLNYLLRTDNFEVFAGMHEHFEEAFRKDSTRSVSLLGMAAPLFSPWANPDEPLEQVWERVMETPGWAWQNPWPGMIGVQQNKEAMPRTEQLEFDGAQRPWSPISWGTMILLTIGGAWQGRVWQRKRRRQKQTATAHEQLAEDLRRLEALQEAIRKDPSAVPLQNLPWPVAGSSHPAPSFAQLGETLTEWSDLTEREKETLFWSLQGERPEEVAERLGCKRSHIYNLRTSLRSKLKIDGTQDWLDWWLTRLPVVLLAICLIGSNGTSAQQLSWAEEMSHLLEMPMDSLVAKSTAETATFTPLEQWTYHGFVAICEGKPDRLEALPRMDTAAVPLVYQWIKPLMTVSDPAVFATWQLAAPRVQGALNTMLGEMNAQAFPALETDNWVVEGTPKEQQWARLRMAQVVIFLLVAAGLVAVFVKQRNGDGHDDMATMDTPGILSQTETDLSQSEVEACIGKSQVSPPEIRAAVNALELLTLPLLAQKAAAVGTLPQVWGQLTQKERQVALLLARRVPPQQISEILRCSPAYVYNMKSELRKKWGLNDSTELDRALLRLI